jgi:hypothetical protein
MVENEEMDPVTVHPLFIMLYRADIKKLEAQKIRAYYKGKRMSIATVPNCRKVSLFLCSLKEAN